MKSLHHWKHWQIFMAVTGYIIIAYVIFIAFTIASVVSEMENLNEEPDPQLIFDKFKYLPLIIFPPVIIQFLWYYSIGSGLQKYLPEGIKMKVGLFRIFTFVPIAFITLMFIMMNYFLSEMNYTIGSNEPPEFFMNPAFPFMMIFFVLFELFTIFCTFYIFYFCAKTFKSAILQREATFSDYVGEFFLLWFHFVGVWIIQPKINKLVQEMKKIE